VFGHTLEAAAAAAKGALSALLPVALVAVVVAVDDGAAILPLAGTTTCRCC